MPSGTAPGAGLAVVDKRKLLWLLGWAQDRRGVWQDLLRLWIEIGQDRNRLRGCEIAGSRIVLTSDSEAHIVPITEWGSHRNVFKFD
jgi:hypothetical protein